MNNDEFWSEVFGYEIRFLSFEEAREFVISLGLKSRKEWKKIKNKNLCKNIPKDPPSVYKKEWKGWGDFLGTFYKHKKIFWSFEEARTLSRKHQFKTPKEWRIYFANEAMMPVAPDATYKEKWEGWKTFLSCESKVDYLSYKDVKKFARELNLRSREEWNKYLQENKIDNIPKDVRGYYSRRNLWESWGEFLGTRRFRNYNWLPYAEAKKYITSKRFHKVEDLKEFLKSDKLEVDIPRSPYAYYKKTGEWKGWKDFLGN